MELENFKKRQFSFSKIKDDPSAVKFYTGFPNASSFEAVLDYFEPKVSQMRYWRGSQQAPLDDSTKSKTGKKRKLSIQDEFFLVLLRLKVGLFVHDISDRFDISPGHFSKIFTTWINFLYHELPLLFPFPSQSLVRSYMPEEFKSYYTTRLIIDGTEIFIQVPSSIAISILV